MRCYGNKGYSYGAYCKNFESREVFDPEIKIKLDTAWCCFHNCPCKDLGYSCSSYESDPEGYRETDKELEDIAKSMIKFNEAVEKYENLKSNTTP
jgi:hypothetical protein